MAGKYARTAVLSLDDLERTPPPATPALIARVQGRYKTARERSSRLIDQAEAASKETRRWSGVLSRLQNQPSECLDCGTVVVGIGRCGPCVEIRVAKARDEMRAVRP